MNRVMLLGNLGQDPEVKTTNSGDKVVNISLATTKRWKDKASGERRDKTEWHKLVLWRAQADIAERYLRKGSKVLVIGELQSRVYTANDGTERNVTEIVVNELEMVDRAPGNGEFNDPARQSPVSRSGRTATVTPQEKPFDDDIPF